MTDTPRRAVRVLCVDASHRVLLLRWRAPLDGGILWEAPGGGVEPGETDRDAAVREVAEETGLDVSGLIIDPPVEVAVSVSWNGVHYDNVEPYFIARFDVDAPALGRGGLMPDEMVSLSDHEWVGWDDTARLDGDVMPEDLPGVLSRLGDGPWRRTPPTR